MKLEQALIGIAGMTCQGCVRSVTSALNATAGVEAVEVSLERAQAKVSFDPAVTSPAALRAVVEEAGFDAS